jgi:hypothetical protein
MRVYINEIRGFADALVALTMSKRTWTIERDRKIREMVRHNTCKSTGFPIAEYSGEFAEAMNKLIKYGVEHGHTTLLRYIDISITVEGLHRAAQDDFDAHAKRLDNRIVRSSTRLATFTDGEKSEWYQDKILYPFEVMSLVGIDLPDTFVNNGTTYVKTDFGYIREDLKDDKDAKRGLYPLAIPSNFIVKVQYPELCHIVQLRDENSHANPELRNMIKSLKSQLTNIYRPLGENLTRLKMEPK